MKSEIFVNKFAHDQEEEHTLSSTDTSWVHELLDELEENLDHQDKAKDGIIDLKLNIIRKENHLLRDHLIIRGSIKASYSAACVRCLEPAAQSFEFDFSACFLNSMLEKNPEFEDTAVVYCDGEEMDLFFYSKGKVDIKEFVHENIFMTIDHLPLHDENCLGLCPVCGINLNKETCSHVTKH